MAGYINVLSIVLVPYVNETQRQQRENHGDSRLLGPRQSSQLQVVKCVGYVVLDITPLALGGPVQYEKLAFLKPLDLLLKKRPQLVGYGFLLSHTFPFYSPLSFCRASSHARVPINFGIN